MNNLDLQNKLLDLASSGYVLLTESERFAHQLLWRFRRRLSESKREGWETPLIITLNQWLERLWTGLWPEAWPASPLKRWQLLGDCIEELPPPEPLSWDIPLILNVDESFEHCLRYGLNPEYGDPANQLVEWRRALWKKYDERLTAEGLFHPAALPEKLCMELCRRPEWIPDKLAAIGFEFAGYWEKNLLKILHGKSRFQPFPLSGGNGTSTASTYADPEQEIYALMENVVSAAHRFPLHELAVVILDAQLYSPLVAKCLEDLLGSPLAGEEGAYNLFPVKSLNHQPLFKAAFLPLEFAREGEPRVLFLSLLRSPYYGKLAPWSRAVSQWDWVWREQGIEKGLNALMGALEPSQLEFLPHEGEGLLRAFSVFLDEGSRKGVDWGRDLRRFWEFLGFPVLANERDQIAWQRLQELMEAVERDLGDCLMRRQEWLAWLDAAAGKVSIQETGYEDAGIQILGVLEARGLSFRHLFVPGFVAGVLPQPVRSLPFLSVEERKGVQGGTVESQFEFARHLFGHLHAVAPELVFSRPMMNQKGETLLPSPFWPEAEEVKLKPVIPWRHDLPALQRARWVREGILGMASNGEEGDMTLRLGRPEGSPPTKGCGGRGLPRFSPNPYQVNGLDVPAEISVSMLEFLLACAGRFFFQKMLGLEPLPELERGLSPSLRGGNIHEILASFGRAVGRDTSSRGGAFADFLEKLRKIVTHAIAPYALLPLWNVEMKRLLGTEDHENGLLPEWFREEWSRLQDGWRWIGLESDFNGLRLRNCPITLKGRLDRVDFHPDEGIICWDYKTGKIPQNKEIWEDLQAPQLPAYLLAIKRGLVSKIDGGSNRLAAGYIDLRSVQHLRHVYCIKTTAEELDSFLRRWEEHAADALDALSRGNLAPCWVEASCGEPCDFQCLCGMALYRV